MDGWVHSMRFHAHHDTHACMHSMGTVYTCFQYTCFKYTRVRFTHDLEAPKQLYTHTHTHYTRMRAHTHTHTHERQERTLGNALECS